MEKVYLVKQGNDVLHFYSETKMKEAGYNSVRKTVSAEEFAKNGGLARVIRNEIVIGKTDEEIEITECEKTEAELQEKLDRTDYKVIKAVETGEVLANINPELAENRASWRNGINTARARLHELGARE